MRLVRNAAAAGVAILAAVAVAACGSSGSPGTKAAGKPTPGGSVTYAVDTEPVCYDVAVSSQDITAEIQRNVVDSLVYESADGRLHPWLATSWTVSKDYRSFTFKLRHDVTFTDGTPFDANAVKVNFDRIADPKTKSEYASTLIKTYARTEVLDRWTARVDFSAPSAPFLQAATTSYLGFYSPKTIAAHGSTLCAEGPDQVGTGPFEVASYTKGQSISFTRNPAYRWAPQGVAHTGAAYLDRLTVRVLPEDATRVGAVTSGQVDAARAIPASDVTQVRATSGLDLHTVHEAGGVYQLFLNVTRGPLRDQRVREALLRGWDIDTAVKTVYFGQYERAWSPLAPSTPDYDAALEGTWKFDPALANKLLDEAGWTGRDAQGYRTKAGRRLTLVWPLLPAQYIRDQRETLGEAFQADLKKIGVQIDRPRYDVGTYTTKGYAGQFDILDFSWARPEPDILRLFFNTASSAATGGQNASFLSDKQIDAWTNEGAATLDPAVRKDVYTRTQQRVIDLAATIPVYVETVDFAVSDHLHGLVWDASGWPQFYGVWTDRK